MNIPPKYQESGRLAAPLQENNPAFVTRLPVRPPSLAAAIGMVLCLAVTGCQLPHRQLTAYREAFEATRSAGEDVVLDFGAARTAYERYQTQWIAAHPEASQPRERLAFDPDEAAEPAPDAILMRLKAFEVLGRYNAALTALAEGRRDPAEIGGALDGLLESIAMLSADAASEIAPFGGVIKTAMGGIQRALEIRKFQQAVTAAQPLIVQLEQFLIADTANFYNIRLGLRNRSYSARTDQLADLRSRFEAVLAQHEHESSGGDRSAAGLVESANAVLIQLPDWTEEDLIKVPDPGPDAYTITVYAQLASLSDRMADLVEEAREIDARFLSYRNLLTAYIRLVRRMSAAHSMLAQAAEDLRINLPPPKELADAVATVRQSITEYQSHR